MNCTRERAMTRRQVRRAARTRTAARGPLTAALAGGLVAAGCGEAEIEAPSLRFAETAVEYPVELWDRDVEGTALVRVLVNAEGGVDSVTIAEGSGEAVLDSAALEGALQMVFEPARVNGKPARVWARVPVHFSKRDAGPGQSEPPPPDGSG